MKKILAKFQYNSPVILTMTLLSALALVLNFITRGWTNLHIFSVGGTAWTNPMTFVRLFTHVIGHADYSHFLNNYMYILLLGPIMEEKYGSKAMLEMIAVTAFITGLLQMLIFKGILLGASGIVFMLILLCSFANYKKGSIPITLILVAILYLSGQIINAVIHPNDGISQMAHIVGGICGTVFGWALTKPKEPKEPKEPAVSI